MHSTPFSASSELLHRYASVLRASWVARAALTPAKREPLERQFLPATLEIIETPAPALAHALTWTIVTIVALTLACGWFGQVDLVATASGKIIATEQRALQTQYQAHRARRASLDAEITKRQTELASARELAAKLAQTASIAKRRAEDYKDLIRQNFMSQHGYLEKQQTSIEQERDHAYQEARVKEPIAAIEETRSRRHSQTAEFERMAVGSKSEADK